MGVGKRGMKKIGPGIYIPRDVDTFYRKSDVKHLYRQILDFLKDGGTNSDVRQKLNFNAFYILEHVVWGDENDSY